MDGSMVKFGEAEFMAEMINDSIYNDDGGSMPRPSQIKVEKEEVHSLESSREEKKFDNVEDRQNILNDQSSEDEEEFNITGSKDMRASNKDNDIREKRPSMPPQFV